MHAIFLNMQSLMTFLSVFLSMLSLTQFICRGDHDGWMVAGEEHSRHVHHRRQVCPQNMNQTRDST